MIELRIGDWGLGMCTKASMGLGFAGSAEEMDRFYKTLAQGADMAKA
jgi:hypothetical protein